MTRHHFSVVFVFMWPPELHSFFFQGKNNIPIPLYPGKVQTCQCLHICLSVAIFVGSLQSCAKCRLSGHITISNLVLTQKAGEQTTVPLMPHYGQSYKWDWIQWHSELFQPIPAIGLPGHQPVHHFKPVQGGFSTENYIHVYIYKVSKTRHINESW